MAVMEPIKIQVNLDFGLNTVLHEDGGGNSYTLGDEVARLLADKLLADAMREMQWEPMHGRVSKMIDAEIARRVAAEFDRTVQPTDGFGQPKGAPTTLAEQIVQQATAWLNRKVDQYRGNQTNLNKLVQDAITNQVKGELAKAVDDAKVEVVTALQKEAAAALVRKMGIRT